MSEEIYVSVSKVPGGYIVDSESGRVIETSLNKAVALVKRALSEDVALTDVVKE